MAEMALSLRQLMRNNINKKNQSQLLRQLNQQFGEIAHLRRFATAVIGTYLADRCQLKLCNAGHPRPLWYKADQAVWNVIPSDSGDSRLTNLPLGIDDSAAYPQAVLELGPGDIVLLYTDALTEATDSEGKMLGEQGLLNLAQSLSTSHPERLALEIVEKLGDYASGREAEDDMTFLVIYHNARGPKRISVGEKLQVLSKVFGLKSV
ncbi:serine/threonine-protein phosphatase [bacterium]|nr:serine/threonine-protein phosphatase [bacterium]